MSNDSGSTDSTPLAVSLTRDVSQARSLLDPLRRSILEALQEPGSSSSVAATMGLPRQRLNYHVRALEAEGLLTHVEDRRKGNCVERVVRANARRHLIDPGILAGPPEALSPSDHTPSFDSEDLLDASCRTLSALAALVGSAPERISRLPTLSLETRIHFRSGADEVEFVNAVRDFLDSMLERYNDEHASTGRTFRITIGGHLDPEASPRGVA